MFLRNFFYDLPDEIIDKIYFELHKKNMVNVIVNLYEYMVRDMIKKNNDFLTWYYKLNM